MLDFREKKNEDGKPLVQFPNNFDSVVNAMNRKDVLSSNNRLLWRKIINWNEYIVGLGPNYCLAKSLTKILANILKGEDIGNILLL